MSQLNRGGSLGRLNSAAAGKCRYAQYSSYRLYSNEHASGAYPRCALADSLARLSQRGWLQTVLGYDRVLIERWRVPTLSAPTLPSPFDMPLGSLSLL